MVEECHRATFVYRKQLGRPIRNRTPYFSLAPHCVVNVDSCPDSSPFSDSDPVAIPMAAAIAGTQPLEVDTTKDYLHPDTAKVSKPSKPQKRKVKAAKKSLLFDDITDCLINHYYTTGDSKPFQCGDSLVDRLRSVNSASSASSGSDSSRTLLNKASSSETLTCKNSPVTTFHPQPDFPTTIERPATAPAPLKPSHGKHANILNLDDFEAADTIKRLAGQYGRISHMGILDRSYSFFINRTRTAALSFKVQNKVAVVEGDPLCNTSGIPELLAEFDEYRKRFRWNIAFMGASGAFTDYAKAHSWTTMQFGRERVLNPMNNDVLLERSGKRIIVQNRQLLDESKGGVTLGLYVPSNEQDHGLQKELTAIYDAWRNERNQSTSMQAFVTVYDPFSFPDLMTYIYTRGPDGVANGFAALRKIGANQGYHLDPCLAAPGAPRGISDLLVFAAMALLNRAGVSYLSFGYEPLEALEEITGMPNSIERVTRRMYDHTFQRLPIGGKKAYHDKFKPDPEQGSSLHVLFPSTIPSPRHVVAIAHMTNVSIRRLVFAEERQSAKDPEAKQRQGKPEKEASDKLVKGGTLEDKLRKPNLSKWSIPSCYG